MLDDATIPELDLDPAQTIKVALVDDHRLFVDVLRVILQTRGIEVAAVGYNWRDAEKIAREVHPDVFLLDMRMPEKTGLDTIAGIHAIDPSIKVVFLTASEEPHDLQKAILLGADGYVLKTLPIDGLIKVIYDVVNGQRSISRSVGLSLIRELAIGEQRDQDRFTEIIERKLDARLKNVLSGLVQGAAYKNMCAQLHISERTILRDVNKLCELFEVPDRSALENLVRSKGLNDLLKDTIQF